MERNYCKDINGRNSIDDTENRNTKLLLVEDDGLSIEIVDRGGKMNDLDVTG